MTQRRMTMGLLGLVLAATCGNVAWAQTPENPDRKETTRPRDNPERRDQPAERNNPAREDPLMSAELQKCYVMPQAEQERCIMAAKRKFGEL